MLVFGLLAHKKNHYENFSQGRASHVHFTLAEHFFNDLMGKKANLPTYQET